jgi:hypothetical protein
MNGEGRPRLPASPDPKVEKRREQYRRSKRQQYERRRHREGKCNRDRGKPCPMLDQETPAVRSSVDGPLYDGQLKLVGKIYLTPSRQRIFVPTNPT